MERSIKAKFDQEFRRFTVSSLDLKQLEDKCVSQFGLSQCSAILEYVDDDGDRVRLANQSDVEEMIRILPVESVIQLRVIPRPAVRDDPLPPSEEEEEFVSLPSNPFGVLQILFQALVPLYHSRISRQAERLMPNLCAALVQAVLANSGDYDIRKVIQIALNHLDSFRALACDPDAIVCVQGALETFAEQFENSRVLAISDLLEAMIGILERGSFLNRNTIASLRACRRHAKVEEVAANHVPQPTTPEPEQPEVPPKPIQISKPLAPVVDQTPQALPPRVPTETPRADQTADSLQITNFSQLRISTCPRAPFQLSWTVRNTGTTPIQSIGLKPLDDNPLMVLTGIRECYVASVCKLLPDKEIELYVSAQNPKAFPATASFQFLELSSGRPLTQPFQFTVSQDTQPCTIVACEPSPPRAAISSPIPPPPPQPQLTVTRYPNLPALVTPGQLMVPSWGVTNTSASVIQAIAIRPLGQNPFKLRTGTNGVVIIHTIPVNPGASIQLSIPLVVPVDCPSQISAQFEACEMPSARVLSEPFSVEVSCSSPRAVQFASQVAVAMPEPQPEPQPEPEQPTAPLYPPQMQADPVTPPTEPEDPTPQVGVQVEVSDQAKLDLLRELGFVDTPLILDLLKKHHGDANVVAMVLLQDQF
eukprot:c21305_g1_i1.p1 GENE.c21305_g1_i1~~c21305_g1_i1.p1  ORF type:complete len:660 (-),score=127.23 c21305_g1_i1:61-2004(-)